MNRKEIVNCPEYKEANAALRYWYSLPEEVRKGIINFDQEPDVIDAYEEGVLYGWNNPNWISVEDELPEKDNEFEDYSKLVVVTDGKDFYKGMYNYGWECWLTHDLRPIEDATYWMEVQLPQSPIKEE